MKSEGGITRRDLLKGGAALGVGAAAASAVFGGRSAPAEGAGTLEGPVNFLGWGGHVEEQEVKDFLAETGVKLNFTAFAENADALTKVRLEGGRRHDLVAVDALWVPKYHELGLLEPLDLKSWPIYNDLFDEFKDLAPWKAGDKTLAVPWAWSPHVLWYNPKYVPGDPTSWDVVWDPKYRKRVVAMRQPVDMIAYVGVAQGVKQPYAMTTGEIARAKDGLIRLKPNILKFVDDASDLVRALVDESAWLTMGATIGTGGRVQLAGGPAVRYFFPKEGYIGYYDGDCLVKGAVHREAAIAWLQHKCQGKYVAMNFLRMNRPLAFKSGYDIVVKQGKGDLAKAMLFDKPEFALKMIVKGAPPNLGDYIDAFNEAMAG